jgi:phospholipase C
MKENGKYPMTEQRNESFTAKPWQAKVSRRRFLGVGAALAGTSALAGYLPETLLRAADASPGGSFDLSQIKHLVFMMQENRSFDHYFGTFPGVQGFSDPNALTLANGRSVFQQPDPANPDTYLEPWHLNTITSGAAAVPSLSHNWVPQHTAWNHGAMDGWLRAHIASDSPVNGPFTMGYYTQADIPFHWALAETFTLLDAYHCSVIGPTGPNRTIWESGNVDPQGLAGGPVLETGTPANVLTWETAATTLYNAGISYKYYWNSGWDIYTLQRDFGPFLNKTATPALYNSAMADGTLFGDGNPGGIGNPASPTMATNPDLAFEEDCANGVLPDVCFIGCAAGADEHPPEIPAGGAQFLAQKLDALAANEDLWNSTVVVVVYDENDGFFDHVPPPIPDKNEYPEEYVTKVSSLGTPGEGLPIGAGFRVPAFIVSPWTVGGNILSAVSDHTSCLQFIEAVTAAGGLSGRNSVTFPNISRWRRATFSNLTGTLPVTTPQALPSNTEFDPAVRAANLSAQTAASKQPMPTAPGATQNMPTQQS